MAGWALALMLAYLALAFGVRVTVALRTTGSTGIASLRAAPTIEVVAGAILFAGVLLGCANPLLALLGVVEPLTALETTAAHAAGLSFCVAGIAGTFIAQMAMGASWRIGVDPNERTELVTGGVFALARNPIYSFMVLAWAGFFLLVPTWLALAAGVLLVVGLELQVRLVEEPYLLRSQGESYRLYARRVGRFLPALGRLH